MHTIPAFTTLGAGPTVLMLHGVGGGHLAFAPQVETLALRGFRAVAWDMPGYGRSAPIEPYNFKGLAARCIALIEHLACGEVTLVGHSMGGMVAQEVAARRPELLARLVLVATTARFGEADGAWQQRFLAERTAPLDAGGSMADLAAALVPRLAGPDALPEGVRLATHCMAQVHPATYRRALAALSGFDRSTALASIAMPTLFIAGTADTTAPPAVMRRMADAVPRSTYLELPGIGHLPQLEAPDEFDAALLDFLRQPRVLH